jgi:beta-galactosidase
MPRNSHLTWMVKYQPGTLSAVAYKNGRKLTAKVETTGAPAQLVLTPNKTTLTANGKDVALINISVVDKQGRAVPDANQQLQFKVMGDAKIIGVGNGNPSSHEADQFKDGETMQRQLFNGKAQVILQSRSASGLVNFEVSAEGMNSAKATLKITSPNSNH